MNALTGGQTQLSRQEVMSLVFEKLMLIQGEVEEAENEHEKGIKLIGNIKNRLKRIVVEARRAASLIETHERHWTVGHCLHCGLTYQEHDDEAARLAPGVRVRAKNIDNPEARCCALRRLFESVEIETYQSVKLETSDV